MCARTVPVGLLAMFAVGCGFSANASSPGDTIDAADLPPDACFTYSAQLDTCTLVVGSNLSLSGALEFDTTTGVLLDTGTGVPIQVTTTMLATLQDPVQAILAQNVTLAPGTTLRAVGSRGFAIIAHGAITLEAGAVIDASNNGAGAATSRCPNGPTKGENDNGGGAGGGGAGFGGAGGKGGDGNSDNIISQSAGGDPGAIAAAAPLGPMGGCPAAAGGNGNQPGGSGGGGGGAVWLAAGNRIEIAAGAGVNVGGGGGGGGNRTSAQGGDAGGGGGGSGGVIWIEAPRVQSLGTLAANGGGGGEGSSDSDAGAPGASGLLTMTAAPGGTGQANNGAAGGDGGYKAAVDGVAGPDPDPGGGGGGGGGVGFIRVLSPDLALAVTSP